ncbi:hypothetical protein MNV49_003206 [Pseudohyphozyma bogoriensis]|nr:hypothetical protein MNV49_003206 [Pseudohyphozyma bogoriensis]
MVGVKATAPVKELPPSTATEFQLNPLKPFGCEIHGIDLNHLDEETFKKLENAVYVHKLVIIRDQKHLDPARQYDLVARFDPVQAGKDGNAKVIHFQGKQNFNSAPAVPAVPQVRFVGVGDIPADHYGTTEPMSLDLNSHRAFHKTPLTDEEMANGDTRFQRWHCDAQFFGQYPAKVTALWIHTAPDPAKGNVNGFGLYSEGMEVPIDELPDSDPEKIQVLPLIWPNPVTGEKGFMVHAIIARKLNLRYSKDGPVEVIEDLPTLRKKLYDLQRPFLQPENILFSPQEEGDMCLWFNRGLRHSAVDLHKSFSPRLVHQCQISGSDNPAFPDPVPGQPNGLQA